MLPDRDSRNRPERLALASLDRLSRDVAVPRYARPSLRAGILHIGVGNFHRSHQSIYMDRLFNECLDLDWAIVGAGIRPFDCTQRQRLAAQDWLTTVVDLGADGVRARVTGSMIEYCEVRARAIVGRLDDPAIRMVTLTITEGGYYIDATTGGLADEHPDVLHDAAHPDDPTCVFGILLAALNRRRARGLAPFTVVSCDNVPHNGDVTRRTTLGLAAMVSVDLADWVAEHVSFPNSMVDCITPETSQRERDLVASRFGIDDAAPVVCEPFRQWVIEDRFPQGRPALERTGVEFVDDVTPFETLKIRVLNAGHAAIAYPAALMGYRTVHEAMEDRDIAGWLDTLMRREVLPVLDTASGVDADDYLMTTVQRFRNPALGDTIRRLCQDGSNRQPKFVLPSLREALRKGASVDGLALELAFWCRHCATAETLDDSRERELAAAARAARHDAKAFLDLRQVFGDLGRCRRLDEAFARQLGVVWTHGPRDALRRYVASPAP